MAGLLAGRHRRPVQFREYLREIAQRGRQRMPFQHPRAHRQHQTAQSRPVGLPGHRAQRFFDRQTRSHQRRHLPGDQRQIGRADPQAPHPPAATPLLAGHLLDPSGFRPRSRSACRAKRGVSASIKPLRWRPLASSAAY
jgi:hypothetical protein